MDCRTALLTLLDQVDYTSGACSPTEMVGAVLPKKVITLCREAAQQGVQSDALIMGANCPDCGCGFRDPHKPDCKYAHR